MLQCPCCRTAERQIKAGRNRAGNQRFQCHSCDRHYTLEPLPNGYPDGVRVQAIRLYLEGTNFRRIGRLLAVNHQSVVNWVNAYHAQLPPTPKGAAKPETVELDELYSFVGSKKKPLYLATAVDRATRCVVGWCVVWERASEAMQLMPDASPPAARYFSDGLRGG